VRAARGRAGGGCAVKFAVIPMGIVADPGLTDRRRRALMALISFRRKATGRAYASLDDIGARCGLHRNTVSSVLNDLHRMGYIAIKRNRRGVNDYEFRFPFHDWQPQDLTDSVNSKHGQELTDSVNPKPDQELTDSVNKTSRIPLTRVNASRETPTDQSSDQGTDQTASGDAVPDLAAAPAPYTTRRKRKLQGWQLQAFEQFWAAFDYRRGKAEAADAWLDLEVTPGVLADILKGATAEAKRRAAAGDNGPAPKWAQGWLSGRRWEDEPEKPKHAAGWGRAEYVN